MTKCTYGHMRPSEYADNLAQTKGFIVRLSKDTDMTMQMHGLHRVFSERTCPKIPYISQRMTKPTKWHVPSMIRVFAVHMKKAWVI